MQRRQRALCLIFSVLIAIFFLSGLLLTLEHDCTHVSCQICSFTSSIRRILAALLMALVPCAVSAAGVLCRRGCLCRVTAFQHAISPITLKVKLSD